MGTIIRSCLKPERKFWGLTIFRLPWKRRSSYQQSDVQADHTTQKLREGSKFINTKPPWKKKFKEENEDAAS